MSEKPLYVRVAEALGVKPRVTWAIMDEEEEGYFDEFESQCAADTELADHLKRYPTGLYVNESAHVVRRETYPLYDTDWSVTGPLIERYRIGVDATVKTFNDLPGDNWIARHGKTKIYGDGATPLEAVCNLLLRLHAAGKLPQERA